MAAFRTRIQVTPISDRITRLEADIDARFAAVNARFTMLENEIDARFTKLEDEIDARFDKLEDDIGARFVAVDARFTKLEENQQEIAVTLARLVALLEARDEAEDRPGGLAK